MEIWRPGNTSQPLPTSEASVEGIGTFHQVSINGNTSFPYLDIQLSWNDEGKLYFRVYRKLSKLVKCLNNDRHHHQNHKAAVLSGVKLCLALLITKTAANENQSISDIYPDKHEALKIAGQLKNGKKMQKLGEVLEDELRSGPTRLKKQSRCMDKHNTLFIVKYANLGKQQQPNSMVIKSLRNAYKLKLLCPHVIYSWHTNLQERLLGDLKRKLLWGVVDADLGKRPFNCPTKFKVYGECAYGGNNSCQTSGTVYKILCKHENCNCFYIGKSQCYIKTRVQEHIGEVTKLYAMNILTTNRSQKSSPPHQSSQTQSTMCSNPFSLKIQQTTLSPGSNKNTPPLCVVIDNKSDTSSIDDPVVGEPPPIPMFAPRP
jgi:hypothetical protein